MIIFIPVYYFAESFFTYSPKLVEFIPQLIIFIGLIIIGMVFEYEIDYTIPAIGSWPSVADLQVSIDVRQITPLMERYDTWADINGNGAYDPDIDTYADVNSNDTFDLVWLAGFGSSTGS